MTYVAYLSHPIGSPDDDEPVFRRSAFDPAMAWLRLLVKHTSWAIMCPWLAYLNAASADGAFGPRALTDQIKLLERCDVVVQVGGWVAPHMSIEANHAKRRDIPVLSLIDLGMRPIQEDHVVRQLHLRAVVLDRSRQRRVWMPPLDELDIAALRAALVALQMDPFSGDARDVIMRIVSAATRP